MGGADPAHVLHRCAVGHGELHVPGGTGELRKAAALPGKIVKLHRGASAVMIMTR